MSPFCVNNGALFWREKKAGAPLSAAAIMGAYQRHFLQDFAPFSFTVTSGSGEDSGFSFTFSSFNFYCFVYFLACENWWFVFLKFSLFVMCQVEKN